MTLTHSARAALLLVIGILAGCAGSGGAPAPDYAAIVAAPDRTDADRKTDQRRDPVKLLAFIGVRPGMKVLEMGAGGGYTAELLARVVGPTGVVYAQEPEDGNARARETYQRRSQSPAMKNVVRVERGFDDPVPPGVTGLDLITFFFAYHDTVYMDVDRAQMNRRLFAVLKPGGVLAVADHSARAGDGTTATKSLHRIEEATLRNELQAAGFQFVDSADFLRHPEDPRDVIVFRSPVPVDEFVLKFVKPR